MFRSNIVDANSPCSDRQCRLRGRGLEPMAGSAWAVYVCHNYSCQGKHGKGKPFWLMGWQRSESLQAHQNNSMV